MRFEGCEVEAGDNFGPFREERSIEEEAKEVATLPPSTQLSGHSAGTRQCQVAQNGKPGHPITGRQSGLSGLFFHLWARAERVPWLPPQLSQKSVPHL